MKLLKGAVAGTVAILAVFVGFIEIGAASSGQLGGWSLILLMFFGPFLVAGLCVMFALTFALNRALKGNVVSLVVLSTIACAVAPFLIFSALAPGIVEDRSALSAFTVLMAIGGAVGGLFGGDWRKREPA